MYIDRFDALKAAHLRETKKNPNCTTLTSLDLKDAFINGLQPRFLKEMILQANPATLKDAKRLAKAKEDNESSGEEETQSSDEEDVTTEKVTRSTRKKSDGHKINEKEKTVAQASTKTKSDNSELQDSMKQLVESFQTLTLFVQTQMNNNNGQRTVKEETCYNCQNPGHDAKQCTSSCKVCQGQLGNHVYWDCLRYWSKNTQGTQQSFLILSSENSDEEGYNAEVEENYAAEKRNQSSSQSELDRKSRSGKRVRVRENIPKIHRTMRKAPATESNKGNRQVTQIIPMEGVEANVVPVVPEKAAIRTNDQEKRIQIRTSVGESPKTAMNSTSQEDLDNGILPGDKIDPADVRHAKVYRCSLAQFENSVTGFRTGLRKLSVKKQTNPRRKQTYQPAHYHAVTREPDESNKTKKKGAPRTEVIVACTILTDAVLDGGSQSTIISLELVKALGIKELLPSRTIHGMADGSDARALGVVPDLTISVQDVIITTRAVVFDHHVYTLLIGMVLPANKNLVPNKAIDGANSNFLQTKKSWAQLLVGPNKTSSYGVQSSTSPNSRSTDAVSENLPSSTSSPSIIPSFNQPFIKGTVAGSVFLDVTPVKDKHLFFQELRQACNDNEHLWSFEDKVKRAGQKLFAEILLSPSMRQTILSCFDMSIRYSLIILD